MQLISNHKQFNHRKEILRLIVNAEEIIICIAFLKQSGVSIILNKLKNKIGKCTFYVGTDFYQTEPEALRQLFKQGHSVYITTKAQSTFHPKIFYFKNKRFVSILIGSANLTEGV